MRIDIKYFVLVPAFLIAAWLAFTPIDLLTINEARVTALCLLMVTFLATSAIPEYLTALSFLLVAMLFSLAPPDIVFSGFQSSALWLVLGGLVLAVAVMSSGLGARMAKTAASYFGSSYIRIISGCVFLGVFFSFLMPSSMGRVILLTPISIAIAQHCSFEHGSKGHLGVVLAIMLGTFLPAFAILPANVPNVVLAGLSEVQYNITMLYGEYLLVHFPVFGLLKSLIIIAVILWLLPDTPILTEDEDEANGDPMSRDEKWLSVLLVMMLVFWITDSVHHISPAWIALAGAIILMLPGISLVNAQQFDQKVNFRSLFVVAGVLALGAIIDQSGVGDKLGTYVINVLPLESGNNFQNYMSIAVGTAITAVLITINGTPAVISPMAEGLSQASGFSIETVLMLQVVGFSTMFFPYQAAPIIVGLQMAGQPIASAIKICLILAFISILILMPVNFLWWSIMGWI